MYNRPPANIVALSICMLAGSRRRSRCSCWWIRPRSRPRLAPRPKPICCSYPAMTAPRSSPLSMCLRNRSTKKAQEKSMFESQQDEEERKTREKMRMNLTLLRTQVLADRRSTIPTPAGGSNLGSHTILQSSWNRR